MVAYISDTELQRRLDAARAELAAGGTVGSAARKLGLSNQLLRDTLTRHAPALLAKFRTALSAKDKAIEARRNRAKASFARTGNIAATAAELGVSKGLVRSDLHALGVDFVATVRGRPRQTVELARVIDYAESGKSLEDTAAHLGLSTFCLRDILQRDFGTTWADLRKPQGKAQDDGLTDAQRRDVATLVTLGKYSRAKAVEAVTRPRRRIAVPPELRP